MQINNGPHIIIEPRSSVSFLLRCARNFFHPLACVSLSFSLLGVHVFVVLAARRACAPSFSLLGMGVLRFAPPFSTLSLLCSAVCVCSAAFAGCSDVVGVVSGCSVVIRCRGISMRFTRLSAMLRLYNIKAAHGWTDKSFTTLLELLKEMLPEDTVLPQCTYQPKKILCKVDLDYDKIHACRNDCVLFRNEYTSLDKCPNPSCGEPRYK
ncbi:hypothetical protein V2J09_000598 [Rumex salicifolius]